MSQTASMLVRLRWLVDRLLAVPVLRLILRLLYGLTEVRRGPVRVSVVGTYPWHEKQCEAAGEALELFVVQPGECGAGPSCLRSLREIVILDAELNPPGTRFLPGAGAVIVSYRLAQTDDADELAVLLQRYEKKICEQLRRGRP